MSIRCKVFMSLFKSSPLLMQGGGGPFVKEYYIGSA